MFILYQILILALLPCDYFEQTSDRDERVMCYIVNSAEYCHKTVSWFLDSWHLLLAVECQLELCMPAC